MMRNIVWLVFGWFGLSLVTAAGARMAPGYVMPDVAVIVVTFLALRREPIPLAMVALFLGYLVGRQASAPVGPHEISLMLSALGVYLVAGHLAGSGALFFGFICGGAVCAYHLVLFGFLLITRGDAAFASISTGLLIPSGIATAILALLLHGLMLRLEAKVAPVRKEGLAWR